MPYVNQDQVSPDGFGPLDGASDGEARLVARQVSELMLARGLRWQAATGTDRLDCLLFQVILSANLAHLPMAPPAARPERSARRAISLMAIAHSMHLPHETVRRRVAHLRARDLVTVDSGGATVRPGALPPAEADVLAAADAAALTEALWSLDADGYAPATRSLAGGATRVLPRVQARALLDFAVRVMQRFVLRYGSMIAGTVHTAIIAANVRHLLAAPTPEMLAGEPPNDADRRPVPLRALARDLDLPWETVRRQAAALAAQGAVELLPEGAVVPSRVITGEVHRRYNRTILIQFERMLAALART